MSCSSPPMVSFTFAFVPSNVPVRVSNVDPAFGPNKGSSFNAVGI
jgi:hypothetical protein